MPDEPVGVKLTFHVDPRQKRNLLSVGLLRKRACEKTKVFSCVLCL